MVCQKASSGSDEPPAEPGRLAVAHGGDVDQALVEVAHDDPERLEVIEQRTDHGTLLRRVRLEGRLLSRIGSRVDVAQAPMQLGMGRVGPLALDGELEQGASHLRQEGARLLEGIGRIRLHGAGMVVLGSGP